MPFYLFLFTDIFIGIINKFSIMLLTWDQFLNSYKGTNKPINEIAAEYTMYMMQNEDEYYITRKVGTNDMILQENGYALTIEGDNLYGLLQELPKL